MLADVGTGQESGRRWFLELRIPVDVLPTVFSLLLVSRGTFRPAKWTLVFSSLFFYAYGVFVMSAHALAAARRSFPYPIAWALMFCCSSHPPWRRRGGVRESRRRLISRTD